MPQTVYSDQKQTNLNEIYFYLTGACNLNCRHCWIDPVFEKKTKHYVPLAIVKKNIDEGIELGLTSVKLTGGEPFLHPDILDIISYISKKNLLLRVETNGTLIGLLEAKALKKANASVSISLDGPTPEIHEYIRRVKGSYSRTIQGLNYLKEYQVSVQVIMSLFRQNSDKIQEMLDLVSHLEVKSLKINPIVKSKRSLQMESDDSLLSIDEILTLYNFIHSIDCKTNIMLDIPPAFRNINDIKKNGLGCCGISSIVGITHMGQAALCGIGEHIPELSFGDTKAQSLGEIWNTHPTLKYIRSDLCKDLLGVCKMCIFKRYCLGKCVAQNYYRTQQLCSSHYFCQTAYEAGKFPRGKLNQT